MLHENIKISFQNLVKTVVLGLNCRTSDANKTCFHFLLTPYIADIPESEEMLSVKRGTRTLSPCHNCLVTNNDFNFNKCGKQTSSKKTLKLLYDKGKSSSLAEEQLHQRSMLPLAPVLCRFLFIGVHRSVGLYTVF